MTKKNENIWIGAEDLVGDEKFYDQAHKEFFDTPAANLLAEEKSLEKATASRRDFLKFMGFGVGAAVVAAGCDTPVRRAIPYVKKPDAIVPGVPTYFASSFVSGGDYVPILVKTREGRPIKIEGNKSSKLYAGGTSARAQACVLELYDTSRYQYPMAKVDGRFAKSSWDDNYKEIKQKLKSARSIRLISNTILSPTTKKAIGKFQEKYPNAQWISYDPVSSAALLDAHEMSYGVRAMPSYHMDKADVIVSLDADFLGTWGQSVAYSNGFISNRKVKDVKNTGNINRLYVVESAMSLTGSNADNRIILSPSELSAATVLLYNQIANRNGGQSLSFSGKVSDSKTASDIKEMAKDLMKAKHPVVMCGSNNLGDQLLTIAINNMLGSDVVDMGNPVYVKQGSDKAMKSFINDMTKGRVDAVIFVDGANPVYDCPEGAEIATAMESVPLSVAMQTLPSETGAACGYVLPVHHLLEQWSDAQPSANTYGLIQPVIEPLYDTRSTAVCLLDLAGMTPSSTERLDYELVKSTASAMGVGNFDKALHDGMATVAHSGGAGSASVDLGMVASKLMKPAGGAEVKFYETVNMGAGQFANNPWLQEMPDPIFRTVWDNFVTVQMTWDGKRTMQGMNGWESGDIVSSTIGGQSLEVPVVPQFGIKENIHGLALGYGRTKSGRAANGVGINVYPLMSRDADGYVVYSAPIALGEKVGHDDDFACVQYHHTFGLKDKDAQGNVVNADEQSIFSIATGYQGALTDRSVVYYADTSNLGEKVEELKHKREHAQHLNQETLYTGHEDKYAKGHKWELSVDLSACTGCGACQVACVAENNVPVVGKKEVKRHHEMTWLRIDRYFFGDLNNPNTVYQPMMCQHCDNAPCENVCPVGATQHSSEGLNHMTYNRCIGTRYCANNCPYKVRRFNWLDYTTADLFGGNESDPLTEAGDVPFYAENMTRMVLNPDVTVRSRGVIEKCSMCVQRIQQGKLEAKIEGRAVRDGDIVPACVSSCPTGGIVFGDTNMEGSEINERNASPLNYYVLEETNVRSGVGYHMKVTNKNNKIKELDA